MNRPESGQFIVYPEYDSPAAEGRSVSSVEVPDALATFMRGSILVIPSLLVEPQEPPGLATKGAHPTGLGPGMTL